jgi:hypothetical protein
MKKLIPSLAVLTAAFGLAGAGPAPAPQKAPAKAISIGTLYCISIGHGRGECHAEVSGATGPVTYTWNPTPYAGSGDYVLIYCTAYRNKTVTLTVSDGSSSSTAQTTFYCGNAV